MLAVVPAAVIPAAALAQGVPVVRLTQADVRFPIDFSSITGFRALSDGTVMITDGVDGSVLRLDFGTGRSTRIGREGQGPGEYRMPDALLPLADGGTMLVDLGNGRLAYLDAEHRVVRTEPIGRPHVSGFLIALPRAVDQRGRFYFEDRSNPGARHDSVAILRFTPNPGTIDTIAKVKRPDVRATSMSSRGGRATGVRVVPLSATDAWTVAPDGRVAIARSSPYRLEWISPDGRVTRGPVVAWTPVAIRDADKREWLDEQREHGLMVGTSTWRTGGTTANFRRGAHGIEMPGPEAYEWAETKGPIARDEVHIAPTGEAWVERSVPAGQPRVFDVFAADGRRVRQVELPLRRRLVGFGPGKVYLREVTADGLSIIERYTH